MIARHRLAGKFLATTACAAAAGLSAGLRPVRPRQPSRSTRFPWPSGRSTSRSSAGRCSTSTSRRCEERRHRRDRVRQPVLQGQGEGCGVPAGDEHARQGRRRDAGPHHVRRRGQPRRPDAAKRRPPSRTITSGSRRPGPGCHAIRVNGQAAGHDADEQMKRAADGLRRLRRVRRPARDQRHRREPRRILEQRGMAGADDREGRSSPGGHAAGLRQLPHCRSNGSEPPGRTD